MLNGCRCLRVGKKSLALYDRGGTRDAASVSKKSYLRDYSVQE